MNSVAGLTSFNSRYAYFLWGRRRCNAPENEVWYKKIFPPLNIYSTILNFNTIRYAFDRNVAKSRRRECVVRFTDAGKDNITGCFCSHGSLHLFTRLPFRLIPKMILEVAS